MCGIAGFVDFKKSSSLSILEKMTDTLTHRGPDDKGYNIFETENAQIGLGHRRLSIIDLSPLGHQPMCYANRYWIVFNGEIYNYKEIKAELINLGYKFVSNSDTEVIMASYDKWGDKAVDKFIGMFAFVLYDTKENRIKIFRDRPGVKPLYYYWQDGVLLFASELKAILKHPTFKRIIDFDAVSLFFTYGYIPQPFSIFKDTFKLEAGHSLTIDIKKQTVKEDSYWDVYNFYARPAMKVSEQEAIEETERLIKSACDYRMVADVPVGVFLSGGYDSSLVTAMLQKDNTQKIKTYSIGFHEKGFDEAPHAKKVAQHLGTDHTEYYCSPKEALEIIPMLPHHYDEPFADSSAIPTTLVSQLARKNVTVALSADAGDEIFAGYNKYDYLLKINNTIGFLPAPLKKAMACTMDKINPAKIPYLNQTYNFSGRYYKIQNTLGAHSVNSINKSASVFFTEREKMSLLKSPNSLKNTYFDAEVELGQKGDFIQTLLAIDYKTYLVDDILTKVDRAGMSVSLEGREPLLDHRIIEWAAQLPIGLKYKKGTKKYILKEIVHKYIPKTMMDRPKMGFGVPIIEWFKKDLNTYFNIYLSKDKIEKQSIFQFQEIESIVNRYESGESGLVNKLWALLMFQLWYEKWIE